MRFSSCSEILRLNFVLFPTPFSLLLSFQIMLLSLAALSPQQRTVRLKLSYRRVRPNIVMGL